MASRLDEEWHKMISAWHPSRPSDKPPYRDYNLGFSSLWFTRSVVDFPPPSMNLKPNTFASKVSFENRRRGMTFDHTMYGVVYDRDSMIKTHLRITWNSSNPLQTVKAEQRHSSPRMLRIRELEIYRDRYSEKLARWAEAKQGKLVGNGECWTLAADGLQAVGALRSPGLWHGYLLFIFNRDKSPFNGGLKERAVVRGDIIQLFHGHFKSKDGRQKIAEPGHTSIIVKVDYEGILYVMESNVTPDKKVVAGLYDLRDMTSGEIRIFRAVSRSWSGEELNILKW